MTPQTVPCLTVNGEFIIDVQPISGFTFENMEIKMLPNAEMTVRQNTRLPMFGTYIHGCTALWNSIKLQEDASSESRICTIKDARSA
ncbi:MAG: hypothetical protein ACK4Q5_09075, partial [Saprospiraceae bacterium]